MKNYTTIEINGRAVGLKFGLPAVRQIFEKTLKQKLEEEDGNYGPYGMAQVLFAGYENNCLVKEIQGDLTFEDFSDFVDQQYVDKSLAKIIDAISVFTNSTIVKGMVESQKKSMIPEMEKITWLTENESRSPLIGTESNLSVTDKSD